MKFVFSKPITSQLGLTLIIYNVLTSPRIKKCLLSCAVMLYRIWIRKSWNLFYWSATRVCRTTACWSLKIHLKCISQRQRTEIFSNSLEEYMSRVLMIWRKLLVISLSILTKFIVTVIVHQICCLFFKKLTDLINLSFKKYS